MAVCGLADAEPDVIGPPLEARHRQQRGQGAHGPLRVEEVDCDGLQSHPLVPPLGVLLVDQLLFEGLVDDGEDPALV